MEIQTPQLKKQVSTDDQEEELDYDNILVPVLDSNASAEFPEVENTTDGEEIDVAFNTAGLTRNSPQVPQVANITEDQLMAIPSVHTLIEKLVKDKLEQHFKGVEMNVSNARKHNVEQTGNTALHSNNRLNGSVNQNQNHQAAVKSSDTTLHVPALNKNT